MTKQVIVIRKDLNMRKGKMCAQAAHASMSFLTKSISGDARIVLTDEQLEWLDSSFRKIVVSVNSEEILHAVHQCALRAGLVSHYIVDNGTTEFGGVPTATCVAIGPHYDERFIGITDQFPLL